jgi:hypothetical protein
MPRRTANTSPIDKLLHRLPTGYAEDIATADEAALRQEILKAVDALAETRAERERDEKLNGAKALVKDLGSGYADALKAQAAKIDYCKHLLTQRGKEAADTMG